MVDDLLCVIVTVGYFCLKGLPQRRVEGFCGVTAKERKGLDQADKLFHSLDWVCDVFEQPGDCSDSMSVGLENGLRFHDKGRVTDTIERSSGQELLNDPGDDFLLISSLLLIDKGNDSLVLINLPILGV